MSQVNRQKLIELIYNEIKENYLPFLRFTKDEGQWTNRNKYVH